MNYVIAILLVIITMIILTDNVSNDSIRIINKSKTNICFWLWIGASNTWQPEPPSKRWPAHQLGSLNFVSVSRSVKYLVGLATT